MKTQRRIPVVIAGALAATVIASAAAFASPSAGVGPEGMGVHAQHMATMPHDADSMGEMHAEMHPQMRGELGQMHRSMARTIR